MSNIYDGLKVGGTFHATRDSGKIREASFTIMAVPSRKRILAARTDQKPEVFAVTAHPNGIVSLDAVNSTWSGAI